MQHAKNSIANAKNTGLNKLTLESRARASKRPAQHHTHRYEAQRTEKKRRCGRPACRSPLLLHNMLVLYNASRLERMHVRIKKNKSREFSQQVMEMWSEKCADLRIGWRQCLASAAAAFSRPTLGTENTRFKLRFSPADEIFIKISFWSGYVTKLIKNFVELKIYTYFSALEIFKRSAAEFV